jgi:antitoxin VapB
MAELEKAKVFMTGRSQAVRIPARYRFKSNEVYIRQDARTGEITLSERPQQPSLTEIFKMLDEAVAAEGPLELDRDMSLPEERDWM